MQLDELQCAIEGMLFAAGEAVEFQELARVLETTTLEIAAAVDGLEYEYMQNNRGLRLARIGAGVQMTTNPALAGKIEDLIEPQRGRALSQAAIEILSIVAYRQPITRREIETIRGVKSDYTISTLIARGLIAVTGRSDSVGRPELLGTTDEFLRVFALENINALPNLENLTAEQLAELEEAGLEAPDATLDQVTLEDLTRSAGREGLWHAPAARDDRPDGQE